MKRFKNILLRAFTATSIDVEILDHLDNIDLNRNTEYLVSTTSDTEMDCSNEIMLLFLS